MPNGDGIILMLNSEELEELRISTMGEKKQHFPNIASLISSSSSLQLMGKDSNANIRSFYYILLTHTFGTPFDPHSDLASREPIGSNEAFSDAQYKLYRIKHLLHSQDIRLSEIRNIPQALQRALSEQFTYQKDNSEYQEGSSYERRIQTLQKTDYKNLYMKKLIFELLGILWRECSKVSSGSSKEGSSKAQGQRHDQIFKVLQEHGVADCLLCIFIRQILFKQYEIDAAEDFNQHIADHAIYTALCDAFGYNGLRLEDNECYISNDSIIYAFNIQESQKGAIGYEPQADRYYIVSLPQGNSSSHNTSENIDIETFRNRRKASRDLKLPEVNQHSVGDSSFARKQSAGIRSSSSSFSVKDRRDVRYFSESVDGQFWGSDRQDKETSKQFNYSELGEETNKVTSPKRQCEKAPIDTNYQGEFSSLSVIMQLSPKVREAMLSSPKYQKHRQFLNASSSYNHK